MAIVVRNGVFRAAAMPPPVAARRRLGPIRVTLALALLVGGAYAGYQRIGTTANIEFVEYNRNLAGGFLAVGMTDQQPGIVVFSALDQEKVQVHVDRYENQVAGTHTEVRVNTPHAKWTERLRGPQVVLIDETGTIEASPVEWTVADFNALRNATDCEHGQSKRCGAPFADLHDFFASWPPARVPDPVRAFVGEYARTDSRSN
ncbi:MAG: hypothetical protein IID37_03065 [Planctomycetes bacterium]|nr:hypothetical protein [Planctomycetota bacterium]